MITVWMRPTSMAMLLLVLVASACSGESATETTSSLEVETFDVLETVVLEAGTVDAIIAGDELGPGYNSTPPTSGARAARWARCGVYRQEIPDIYQVASLSRGTVIVHYRASFTADARDTVEQVVAGLGSGVIAAPNSDLSAPIVLTAWGALLQLQVVDPGRIGTFIEQYGGQGPSNEPCPQLVDER